MKVFGLGFVSGVGALLFYNHSGKQHEGEKIQVPGDKMSLKSTILDVGAASKQQFLPIANVHQHVCGFHFYADDMSRQVRAHHFCACVNNDVRQCLIYDGDTNDARLIGIEYMISEKLFKSLPDEEKKYWHSHHFEVKGGAIHLPTVPALVENEAFKDIMYLYGKTIHTWQVDRGDTLPLGPPQLMMSFTQEGQLHKDLIQKRDEQYKVNIQDLIKQREGIKGPERDSKADQWEKTGKAHQLKFVEVPLKKN